ncbi:MAG TPA: methylenetetrahydrofolate reductase [NAD(P)H] [Thermoleophilaceae bacterium]|nr:methylenetetrahydrofolate reductase [NAD(P)H] [Thermoleophilaceae bacterium]
MRIDRILAEKRPVFSFEFFPPKTDDGLRNLEAALEDLSKDAPDFVSVTYGALGTTRERTVEITKGIKSRYGIEAMSHLTCVGATRGELLGVLREIEACGIENVLALRGDPPQGEAEWTFTEGGLRYSTELATLVRSECGLCVGAAAFPEVHPEAEDRASDIRFLKEKVNAGASFLITQLFYDNELYFDFVDDCRGAGIDVPIVPGVMPITNHAQIKRITQMCGATIPETVERELDARSDDPEAVIEFGVAYATLQCADLLARGAPGIHFYTLNKSPATRAILAALRAARPWDRVPEPV